MTLDPIATLELTRWTGPFDDATRAKAQDALESGKVLYFPKLPFTVGNSENVLLTDALSNGRAKNISRDPDGKIQGDAAAPEESARLSLLMGRFAEHARALVLALFPGYAGGIEQARTSYRRSRSRGGPIRRATTTSGCTSMPSRRGRSADGASCACSPTSIRWAASASGMSASRSRTSPNATRRAREKPLPLEPWLFELLGVTKGRRSDYDYLMLGLHDGAKLDADYQRNAPQIEFAFPARTTWMCFTDQAMHAALKGQFALEQTFHLPVESLAHPERAPLKVLERMVGRALA
ncbi:MAG: Kdo hydroxylase family protein [Rhizomicrobium sp.]